MPAAPHAPTLRPRLGVLVGRLTLPLAGFMTLVGIALFVIWPPEWADGSAASLREQWLCVLVSALSGPAVLAVHYLAVRTRRWRFFPDRLEILRGERVVGSIPRDDVAEIRMRAAGVIVITTDQRTRFLTYVDRASAAATLVDAGWTGSASG